MNKAERRAYFKAIGYEPHASQWLFHDSTARFRLPCCGRRFGKSMMSARDLEPYMIDSRLKNRYWCVGPTYDLGEKEFRVVWDDLIVGLALGRDKRIKKAYSKRSGEMYIEMPWGTRLEVRSADRPDSLVGEALDGVIMSESAKHRKETWERLIRPALADRRGWAVFPTTPEGFNWYYFLWRLGQDPSWQEKNMFESWRFPSWYNTAVYPGGENDPEILMLKQTVTPEWFLQEIAADFASFVGKIFPEFDETVHVNDWVFRPEWPNYIAFDWGYTNPLVAMEFQVSPWDDIYVWREHYLSFTRLEEHVRLLKARSNPAGYHLDLAFGDAADPEAADYISAHLVGCVADPDAKSNWRQGIDRLKTFLRLEDKGQLLDEFGTPLLVPRYYVDRSCKNHIREMQNYRAKDASKSQGDVQDIGRAGGAVKKDDHTIDAMRYAVVSLYDLGAQHHLSELYSETDLASDAPESGYFTTEVDF